MDELYDTIGGDGFASLPSLLAEAVGARSCSFQVLAADGTPEVVETSYFPKAMDRYYVEQEIFLDDVWQRRTQNVALGRSVDLLHYVSDEEYIASRFYQEMIRPFGDDTGRCIGVLLPTEDRRIIGVGLHRPLGDYGFSPDHVAALDELSPHLRRIVQAQSRIERSQLIQSTWRAAIEAMPEAAMVIAPDGRLAMANAAGRTILRRQDGLSAANGRLEATVPVQRERLALCIHRALHRENERGGAALIARPAPLRPYRLTVFPFQAGELTHALVLISDPDREMPDRLSLLRQLYGFTRAESEVALLIAEGLSVDQVADHREVSAATVKTLLQRVYHKADVGKAAELAKLVAELPT